MIAMVMGFPASGKSTLTKQLEAKGYRVLNRDTEGGSMSGLLEKFKAALADQTPIVLDNTFCTVEDRKPFIEAAKAAGRGMTCWWLATRAEDAQINALNRMWDRYGQVFMSADAIKNSSASKDPNIFPAAAIFSYKKRFEKPTMGEGFALIQKMDFVRLPGKGTKKALILDYDGTLRRDAKELGGEFHYPVKPEQVEILPNRTPVLERYKAQGYLLLGASTQSGIAKGHLTDREAMACFAKTNALLGVDIEFTFCPHGSFPVACYCRKPQAGLGVYLIRKYDLNPADCIMVGDLTTDRTFAERLGFQFRHADEFFKE